MRLGAQHRTTTIWMCNAALRKSKSFHWETHQSTSCSWDFSSICRFSAWIKKWTKIISYWGTHRRSRSLHPGNYSEPNAAFVSDRAVKAGPIWRALTPSLHVHQVCDGDVFFLAPTFWEVFHSLIRVQRHKATTTMSDAAVYVCGCHGLAFSLGGRRLHGTHTSLTLMASSVGNRTRNLCLGRRNQYEPSYRGRSSFWESSYFLDLAVLR